MIVAREVLLNYAIRVPFVRALARARHVTGMNEDRAAILATTEFYESHLRFEGRRILELGPGQTFGVLREALARGADSCVALDIVRYFSDKEATNQGIDYRIFDGGRMPLEDSSVDLIVSSDVFEHVRQPSEVLRESRRVLREGGMLVSRVDLRDHFFLSDKSGWLNCFEYSERTWNLMTFNRSNFINRLRQSEWQELAERAGFTKVETKPLYEVSLLELRDKFPRLKEMTEEDVQTWRVDLLCVK